MMNTMLRCLTITLFLFSCTAPLAFAQERTLPKKMTPAKLEKSVHRQLKYIDKRLLAGKSADQILNSGNNKAISILNESKENRDIIAKQIEKGEIEAAYWALKDLGNSLRSAAKLVRAKELSAKKIKNDLDSARIKSDAYEERAKQRSIHDGNGGEEAHKLYKRAIEKRKEASLLEKNNKYKDATAVYLSSMELLKKAIATSKRQGYSSSKTNKEEKRALPKGMTPKKLKKSVIRQFKYIDTRLLSDKNAQKVKESENSEAITLFARGQKRINTIASKIDEEEYEEAYWALQKLAKTLKNAMKLARAKEIEARNDKNEMDSARITSDAYLERAKQRGIHEGAGGTVALELFKRAETERIDAIDAESKAQYKWASKGYQLSTEFLKKSIASAREWQRSNE